MAYLADASHLEPGSIVLVERPLGSAGKPTYPHYFIVLATPEHPKPGDVIPLIGISSRIDPQRANPALHIPMKWLNRRGGDPETGFDRPCHACLDFVGELQVYRGRFASEVAAEHRGRFIRAEKLSQIIEAIDRLSRRR